MGENALFIAGAALLLVGIIGGGFEIHEMKMPRVSNPMRTCAFITGVALTSMGFSVHRAPGNSEPPRVTPEELLAAIRTADNVQIRARQSLDTTILSSAYTGEALRTQIEGVKSLIDQGLYGYEQLDNQELRSVQVKGSEADVELTETWSAVYYRSQDDQCVSQTRGEQVPQTIRLQYSKNGWMVSNFLEDLHTPAGSADACDSASG
jgi:hypothetical protein